MARSPEAGTARGVRLIASDDEAVAAAGEYAEAIAAGAAERDRTGAVPREELALFDRSGLLGITVPAEHGGADSRRARWPR